MQRELTKSAALLQELVLNGEIARKDLPAILGCSPRWVSEIIGEFKQLNWIYVARNFGTCAGGKKQDYLGITLEGLSHFFKVIPDLWTNFDRITTAPQNQRLLPLVFGKISLFKGIEVQNDGRDIYEIMIDRLKDIFLMIDKRRFFYDQNLNYFASNKDKISASMRELGYKAAKSRLAGKPLYSAYPPGDPEGIKISQQFSKMLGIENEIYLNLYFRYNSIYDPFTWVTVPIIKNVVDEWSKPSGWWGEIFSQIMAVAAKDPDLRLFESTIKARRAYIQSSENAFNALEKTWKKSVEMSDRS